MTLLHPKKLFWPMEGTMANPVVSVIIPNYDDTHLIPSAVESVRRTDPHTEVVLVDNTGDRRIHDLGRADDVRVVTAPPQPPGHNRNVGLRRASAPFIQFLDADDRLINGGLLPRVDALRESNVALAVGPTVRVTARGGRTTESLGRVDGNLGAAYLRGEFQSTLGGVLCDGDALVGFRFDERFHRAQDLHLWARLFNRFDATVVDEPAFEYHQHPRQRSGKNIHDRYSEVRRVARDLARYPALEDAAKHRVRLAYIAEAVAYRRSLGLPPLSQPVKRLRKVLGRDPA